MIREETAVRRNTDFYIGAIAKLEETNRRMVQKVQNMKTQEQKQARPITIGR